MRTGPPPRTQQVFTLLLMVGMLVMVLVTRQQCGRGAAGLLNTLDAPGSAPPGPPPGPGPAGGERGGSPSR